VHRTLEPVAALHQEFSINPPVPIIHEDRFSVVTALHMVNGDTWEENARDARHIRTRRKMSEGVPFASTRRPLRGSWVTRRQYSVAGDVHRHQNMLNGHKTSRAFNDSDPLNRRPLEPHAPADVSPAARGHQLAFGATFVIAA
jgi:hypothetical protein